MLSRDEQDEETETDREPDELLERTVDICVFFLFIIELERNGISEVTEELLNYFYNFY